MEVRQVRIVEIVTEPVVNNGYELCKRLVHLQHPKLDFYGAIF